MIILERSINNFSFFSYLSLSLSLSLSWHKTIFNESCFEHKNIVSALNKNLKKQKKRINRQRENTLSAGYVCGLAACFADGAWRTARKQIIPRD